MKIDRRDAGRLEHREEAASSRELQDHCQGKHQGEPDASGAGSRTTGVLCSSWDIWVFEHDEPSVCISGAQGVLGSAAVHGAVELGRNPLQHKLLPVKLGTAIQEAAAHSRPREHGFWEDLILKSVD